MLPARGRPGKVLLMEVERELTSADILRLATAPAPKVGTPTVQKLAARHHRIAILLASGRTRFEVAMAVGLTPQRVGDLQNTDPAFRELLAYYEAQVKDISLDEAQEFHGRLTDVSRTSLEEIQERLADPEQRKKMTIGELRQLTEMALDRTTNPPKTAQPPIPTVNKITFNMGPRAKEVQAKVIDQEGREVRPTEIEMEDEDV